MLLNTHRVLVVDDIADNLILLQTVLESEGYIVETAQSGKAALDKLEEVEPDIVLLDIMMPGLNGYEVTRQLRQHEKFSSVPIVLLTAHDEFFQKPYREVGANDLIRKPIDFDELLDKVANYTRSESSVA